MGKRNKFPEGIKHKARKRQHELCASCGGGLNGQTDEGFQVVPRKSSGDDDSDSGKHVWVRSADNCVMVCDGCYFKHSRKWVKRPRPDDFRFSHGKNKAAHQRWLGDMRVLELHAWSSTDEGFDNTNDSDDDSDSGNAND